MRDRLTPGAPARDAVETARHARQEILEAALAEKYPATALTLAKMEYLPNSALSGEFDHILQEGAQPLPGVTEVYDFGIGFNIPPFLWYQQRDDVTSAQHNLQAARCNLNPVLTQTGAPVAQLDHSAQFACESAQEFKGALITPDRQAIPSGIDRLSDGQSRLPYFVPGITEHRCGAPHLPSERQSVLRRSSGGGAGNGGSVTKMKNATATKGSPLMALSGLTTACLVLSMLGACERWMPSRADPDSVSSEIASGYYIRPSEKASLVHAADGRELMVIAHLQSQEGSIGTVREATLPGILEATGQVTFDDRLVSTISSRVSGRVEEMRTSQWEMVERGRVVMVLFSPDFMTAEEEYLQATSGSNQSYGHRARTETSFGIPVDGLSMSASLKAAAIRKLQLLGFTPADIAAIRVPSTSVAMRAPISGIIVSNNAMRGQQVNPGDQLFSLATLQRVWITADIYQSDMSRVRVGQNLEAVTAAYPGEVFKGTVQRISPALDPNIHTMELRCQVNNPGSLLRPQMLARVRLVTPPGLALVLPQKALVFDDNAYFAFIVAGGDAVERRKVAIADWGEPGFARVVSGIKPGDRFLTESVKFNSLWHAAHSKT